MTRDAVMAPVAGCFATAMICRLGFFSEPLLGDRAYFVYLAQAVWRGEAIYETTFFYYPPLGVLVSAAAIGAGRLAAVPDYLAPRAASVLVGGCSAALLFAVTRRATTSPWSPVVAVLALCGFGELSRLTLGTLEPKVLLVGFSLLGCLATQRRRWGWAGLASGAAVTCWQPGGLVGLACLSSGLAAERGRRGTTLGVFAAGAAAGALPALLYLTGTGSGVGFWRRAVMFPLTADLHLGSAPTPGRWLGVMTESYTGELGFFAAAALGVGWFGLRGLRRRGGENGAQSEVARRGHWLAPALGGMPLLALGWVAFNSFEFQGVPDMIPILPIVAFWAAWAFDRLLALGRRALPATLAAGIGAQALAAIGTLAVAVYALGDVFTYEPAARLRDERAFVARILARAAEGEVVAFDVPEVYVFGGRRSPLGILSLNRYFAPVADLVGLEDCDAVWRALRALRPAIVVSSRKTTQSECVRKLGRRLLDARYEQREPTRRERARFPFGALYWYVFVSPDAREAGQRMERHEANTSQ